MSIKSVMDFLMFLAVCFTFLVVGYIVLRTGTQAVLRTYYTELRAHLLECRRLNIEGDHNG